jgi:hypothetical protein
LVDFGQIQAKIGPKSGPKPGRNRPKSRAKSHVIVVRHKLLEHWALESDIGFHMQSVLEFFNINRARAVIVEKLAMRAERGQNVTKKSWSRTCSAEAPRADRSHR